MTVKNILLGFLMCGFLVGSISCTKELHDWQLKPLSSDLVFKDLVHPTFRVIVS